MWVAIALAVLSVYPVIYWIQDIRKQLRERRACLNAIKVLKKDLKE